MQVGTADLVTTDYIADVQRLGVPVRNMGGMLKFYGDLKSEEAFSTRDNERRVMFVK